MKIRVLHIIDHLGPGGAQVLVKNIAEKISNEHIETFVCALRTSPLAIPVEARLINLTYRKYNPCAIFAIAKLCKKYKIDILHAHLTKSVITSLMANFISKTPVIVHEHGPIFRKGLPFSIYRVLLRMFHNRAAAIVANSQATARQLVQSAAIGANGVEVIPNALDFGPFDSSKVARSKARAKLGISEKDIVVGFVGRLHRVKGVDILIQAVCSLLRQSSNYLLVIAGDGPQRDSLEALAAQLGIAHRAKFLGMCDKAAEVMSAFDIGIVPSRQEPFGIVLLELMRMKVPVVSSGVDGMGELVSNGQTALVAEPNTPASICDCVKRLVEDVQLQRRLTENAYKFSEQFALTNQTDSIKKLYYQICKDVD